MNVVQRARASLKAFVMAWARGASWGMSWFSNTEYDYATAAGDGRSNAAVMACVRWVQRALPEAPLIVKQRGADGDLQDMPDHPLQDKLEHPNPYYSGLHLIGALVADLMLTGNAYIIKARNGASRVVELWWVPSTMIEPRWPEDGSAFISHYDYTVDGRPVRLETSEIVHIRQGFDPRNIRKGLSDLSSLLREIATDNEAANWTAAMVRNVTPPGVVVTPGKDVALSQENADQIKSEFAAKFGGDRKGSALVLSAEADVRVLSFSPEQMNLREIRNVPEERITAVFGIPAAVVGLGTGLEQTKVGATLDAMERQAYKSCLIPMQRLIMAELQMQLVPDFGDPTRLRVVFDLDQVSVLQEDHNSLHERARGDLQAGLITLNQALKMIGEDDAGPTGEVRYLPTGITVKPADDLLPALAPAALQPPTPLRALPAPQDGGDEIATRSIGQGAVASEGTQRVGQRRDQHGIVGLGQGSHAADPVRVASGDERRHMRNPRDGSVDVVAVLDDDHHASSVARKGIDDIPGLFDLLLQDDEPAWRKAVRSYLNDELARVIARLATGDETAEMLVPDTESGLLRDILDPHQRATLESIRRITAAELGVAFNIPDPAVREYLEDVGQNLISITGHTRDKVREALIAGQAEGEGIPQIVKRIRALTTFGKTRAETIARTELGMAQNLATLAAYRASGVVVGVRVLDGQDYDEACRAMHGRTFPLDKVPAALEHTRCRRAFAPIVDVDEIEGAA